ncbi:MAG: hypothetical protein U1F11_05990 [Steroidobacteraceae bacterium]
MTRTGRVDAQRLWRDYPAFMKKYEQRWNAWHAPAAARSAS